MGALKNRTIFKFYEKLQNFFDYSITIRDKLPGHNVLVISTNPGDEALGCAGTIMSHVKNGGVVNVLYSCLQNSDGLKEQENIARMMGAKNIYFIPQVGGSGKGKAMKFQEALLRVISKLKPDIVFMPSMLEPDSRNLSISKTLVQLRKQIDLNFLIFAYSVTMPVLPNSLVDISNFAPQKKKILECVNQFKANTNFDYAKIAFGIDQYWAQSQGASMNFAEVFFMATANKYITLAKNI
jgi:LmbE family N-acetylglucosaminyl deacetylase